MDEIAARIQRRVQELYGDNAEETTARLLALAKRYGTRLPSGRTAAWDEKDIVLITYGDQVRDHHKPTLAALSDFLREEKLDDALSIVHLLPIFPYSSDDGFSVIDFRRIDPALGDWEDVRRLGSRFGLMLDLVLNHVSRESEWYRGYLQGTDPYTRYFIESDPDADLSNVVRPRSLPLLTQADTSRGPRHLWTTFSADQIDLNYASPDVLVEMMDILLQYVEEGARVVRLDAVAYLWKEPGTPCIHLPETHEVVKLMRDVLALVAPHVLLLTETNVPHRENVSYLGDGDEAHMVYQFSLPPLLLDAMLHQDATPLKDWLRDLEPPREGTSYFNFTASHDGVGVRPLEGIVSEERLSSLVTAVRIRGGKVSTRRQPDGTDTPYELNISYVSALADPDDANPAVHARRFLTTQGVMLALQGMPAVYFHSLVGSENDLAGAEASGIPRRINRHKYERSELNNLLATPGSLQATIYRGYRHMLAVRREQPAFHPDAQQRVHETTEPWLLAFDRVNTQAGQAILVLANFSAENRSIDLRRFPGGTWRTDLLTASALSDEGRVQLPAWGLVWLAGPPEAMR